MTSNKQKIKQNKELEERATRPTEEFYDPQKPRSSRKFKDYVLIGVIAFSGSLAGSLLADHIQSHGASREVTNIKDKIEHLDQKIEQVQSELSDMKDQLEDIDMTVTRLDVKGRRLELIRESRENDKIKAYFGALEAWKSQPWWKRLFSKKPKPEDYGLSKDWAE